MVVLAILLLWRVEPGLSDCESVDRRLELADNSQDLGAGVFVR